MFEQVSQAFSLALSWETLLALAIGGMFGTIIGALPGLGTAVAITVCIPFTMLMPSPAAIALLLAVYCCSIYGGSITAVLLNVPGTPQNACTAFDGYAMAKKGQAAQALGWVTLSSTLGGFSACFVVILAAPFLASLSVRYAGPLEISALICMGLACITSLSEGNQVKGLLMGFLGLFLATVGTDPLSGEMRFTFDFGFLAGGIDLMPVVVGIFPLAELFSRVYDEHSDTVSTPVECRKIIFPKLREWKGRLGTLLRSIAIGVGLGVLPGTGATAATFISYGSAKRLSPRRENIGKGEPDGLIAAESSSNANGTTCMVPTLALGIPGEPVMAIMLATFTLHGITPGVQLMQDNPVIVYVTFITLCAANLLILPTGMLVTRVFGYLLRMPTSLLLSMILISSILGVYLPRGNVTDVWIALVIGICAFALRLGNFPMGPLIIGYVLGPQLEYRIGQAAIYQGNRTVLEYVLASPLATVLLIIAALLLVLPFITAFRKRNKPKPPSSCEV